MKIFLFTFLLSAFFFGCSNQEDNSFEDMNIQATIDDGIKIVLENITVTPTPSPTETPIPPTATSIPTPMPTPTPEDKLKPNLGSEKVTFEILDKHPDFECLSIELNRFINVYGVYVISHDSIPEKFMLHTANILAEYIDNDLDGIPDDMNVINSLRDNNYVVPVWTEELREKHFPSQRRTPCEDNIGYAASMYMTDAWALGGIIKDGNFDGNIEEVWHVISRGWYDAYPEYFGVGYKNISKLNKAMDIARGGKFKDVPSKYPEGAWYSYYDESCVYPCQASEYFYWAVAANIGALDPVYTNKCESSSHEWNICTKEELKEKDSDIYELLNNEGFKLPKNIPLGKYLPFENCEAAPPDKLGNIVNWCDNATAWWIDSMTGKRREMDALGNVTTPNASSLPADFTGPVDAYGKTISPREWGLDTSIFSDNSDTNECAEKSEFSEDNLSSRSRNNLELITGMNIYDITTADLTKLTKLDAENLVSYDELKYLTCLKWLSLGYKQPMLGRDFRFLKSLEEIRYLDLTGTQFRDVELLKTLKRLETIVLPHGFQAFTDLAQITSLRRISSPAARTCSIEGILNMPNLETLHVEGRNSSGAASYHQWTQLDELNRDFNISFSPNGQYLQLLIDGGPEAFNPAPLTINSYQDPQYIMDVTQSIYEVVEDDYDVIVFVGNAESSNASYLGQANEISNNTEGLGSRIWSTAECHGSKEGKLRGTITLPSIASLWDEDYGSDGTLVHELIHLWGGADILPVFEDFNGYIHGGHWGVTSVNGQLGGFSAKDLETIDDGVYRTNYFSAVGSSADTSLSELELYIMGVLPASEVPDTIVFRGVTKLNENNTCEDYGYESWDGKCFRATEQTSVSIEDIIKVFGERPYEGELDISMLVVAVSEEPLTSSEWSLLDQHISRFADTKPRSDLCWEIYGICHNMWSASNGKISIDMNRN